MDDVFDYSEKKPCRLYRNVSDTKRHVASTIMSKIRHVNTAVLEHVFGIAMGIAVPLFLSMKLADYLEEEEEVLGPTCDTATLLGPYCCSRLLNCNTFYGQILS